MNTPPAILASLCALALASAHPEDRAVGVVELHTVGNGSLHFKDIIEKLKAEFDARITALEDEEHSIKVLGSVVLGYNDDETIKKQKEERDKKIAAYAEKAKKLFSEVNERRNEVLKPMFKEVDAAIEIVKQRHQMKEIKRAERTDDKSNPMWTDESKKWLAEYENVTSEVLEVLNASYRTNAKK